MTDFLDLLKKRRSVRDYEEREVGLDLLKEIARESCLAPSSGNGQPWQFIIINNKKWIRKLSDESKKNILSHIEKNPDAYMKKYETVLRNKHFNVFYNAPCLVFVGGAKKIGSLQVDCALAASYFMFSASEKGLATCWIGLGTSIHDPEIKKQIGMPVDYRIVAPIAVGYPKNIPNIPERLEPRILKIVS